jgi:hypothetical protein
MAEWSQTSKTIAFTIGKEENISIVNKGYSGEKPFEIVQMNGETKMIPESRNNGGSIDIYLMGQIKDAGNYQLNFGDEAVIGAGFNFDRQESDLSCITNLNSYLLENGMSNFLILEDKGPEEELGIEKKDNTKEYWQWCIILALIFLLIESLILRLWKE